MRQPLAVLLLLAAAVPGTVAIASGAGAAGVSKPESLLPSGYKAEQVVRIDFDADGDKDAVVVGADGPVPAKEIGPDEGDGERLLLVARNDKGSFTKIGLGRGAVLCRACGGAFWGETIPPIEIMAAKGGFTVAQSAGSNEVVDWLHRYRIEKGKVRLIGLDLTHTMRTTGEVTVISTNYLTGLTITTTTSIAEQPDAETSKTTKGKARTIYLESVTLE